MRFNDFNYIYFKYLSKSLIEVTNFRLINQGWKNSMKSSSRVIDMRFVKQDNEDGLFFYYLVDRVQ